MALVTGLRSIGVSAHIVMLTVGFTLPMVMTVNTGKATGAPRVVTFGAVQIVIARQWEGMMEGRWIPGGGGMTLLTGL